MDQSHLEDLDYLDDMLEATEKIQRYTDGMNHEKFVSDEMKFLVKPVS